MDRIQAKIIYDEHSMPIQPVYKGRFIPNRIVSHLLDNGTIDLNDLAVMDFSDNEREQFAQLIGYSVSGFGSLSYVQDETYETAYNMEEGSMTELEARIKYLQDTLDAVRQDLKKLVPRVFRIHPEDLIE